MPRSRVARRLQLGCVLAMAVIAIGCGAKRVNDLLADPGKYRDRSVTVQGTVDQSASVMGSGAYRLVDGDQGLWVVTTGGAPRMGARVDGSGRLQVGYDLSGFGGVLKVPPSLQSGLVLVASSHKARN